MLLPFLLLLLSEPSANFLQLRGRRRQGRRRTFPGFGFQCGARAFASQGGVGGTPDALLGPWEPGAGRRLAGRAGVGTVGRRGGGALTSVLEQDVRQPMLDPLVRRGGGRRNLRVHTLDASCRRQGGHGWHQLFSRHLYATGFYAFPFPADSTHRCKLWLTRKLMSQKAF